MSGSGRSQVIDTTTMRNLSLRSLLRLVQGLEVGPSVLVRGFPSEQS